MTTYFVTRHPGALAWANRQGLMIDRVVTHLDPAQIRPGDQVIGTLPIHLVSQICAQGARFFHLTLNLPPEARGQELSADDLEHYQAGLEEYYVEQQS